eukprot:CCRYP_013739-RA/>CCRYP_013739-RA protein AED:0.51 eAED:0.37 QI:0/0/0/1/0/0/2/0/343
MGGAEAQPPLKPTSSTHSAEHRQCPSGAPTSQRLPSSKHPRTPATPWQQNQANPSQMFTLCSPCHLPGTSTSALLPSQQQQAHDNLDSGRWPLPQRRSPLGQAPHSRPSTVGVHMAALAWGNMPSLCPSASVPNSCRRDSFGDFPTSLMVGKTSERHHLHLHQRWSHDPQRTGRAHPCHGKPAPHWGRDEQGATAPLVQHRGQWQPRIPSKRHAVPSQAHSVYDLPSTEEAIKWMHAVCGYSSQIHLAVQAGNFIGWHSTSPPRMYKSTTLTLPKHPRDTNQTRKNIRFYKPKPHPSRKSTPTNSGPQMCDTIFTDQTGHSLRQAGNKYIMVMVEIDSSAHPC